MPIHSDYCPISLGVEIIGDRWTPLIIRELMVGAGGFNEIHRGVPKMSRTLLAQRLRQLERHGLVTREAAERGRAGRYALTEAGESMTPIIWAIGHWAAEWLFDDPDDEDCDGLSLIWRMHQHAVADRLPHRRTVVHLDFTGPGAAEGWYAIEGSAITVCRDDPGLDVDLWLTAVTQQMHRWLVGRAPFRALLDGGHAELRGPSQLVRDFPTWFDTSFFAQGLLRAEQRRAGLASMDAARTAGAVPAIA
ncbi:helix-turn-helix transcriptional regulator [Frankia sp. CNm7]|uniref:Helix-turn-helix transcriptional regulator n=1 Tax=Frankia nepalensis TaxID=1836974 RepID=A0A937RT13_9ACTN|nr:helix-turn-helix domain-containing protein [Frankia nepalensis]MBL7499978.1 helix-turn-helix transcriptional regulator [Frankia nepalensis]MBL7512511.1 helix-turn-helix transcriptional regulator [Frankia nepalensis]MBL7517436.1 helix-turn-helix transcriptional regulator [Frankia nepalensis]MBL7632814.1 helix-turn-helix transcriptional regulator [Frankia nepalensis]